MHCEQLGTSHKASCVPGYDVGIIGHPQMSSLSLFLVFRDRVSLCSPGCPGTHFVDQAALELRNPPAPTSQVLGLKACTTTPGPGWLLTDFPASAFHVLGEIKGVRHHAPLNF